MPSTVAPAFFSRSQKSAPLAGKCGEKKTKFTDDPSDGEALRPRLHASLAHLPRMGKSAREWWNGSPLACPWGLLDKPRHEHARLLRRFPSDRLCRRDRARAGIDPA